jgi:hypothetical protein
LTKPDERTIYEIDFNPPDGVSKLLSAEIIVKGDFPPSSLITIILNGQPCNPREWRTPESDKKFLENYESVFECVDNAKDMIGRKWNLDFSTDAIASNVRISYTSKYYNDWNLPEVLRNELGGTMAMHGTEYTVGDRAKIWLQAIDSSGKSVNNAACYADIYYPYGTPFIERATMSLLEDGIYYYDIMVPDVVGVYPVLGLCYYGIATQEKTADSGYILNGTQGTGSYLSTATMNNVYWNVDEALVNGIQRIAVGLNYTSIASLTGLTEVDFNFQGRWNGGTDVITIYFYNWTSSNWQALPNTIPDTGSADLDVTNSIATTNATISGIRYNGEVYIQFRDSTDADVTSSRLRIDYMAVNLLNLSGDKSTEIKGSSEIHAKADLLSSSDYLDVQTPCGRVDPLIPDGCGSLLDLDAFMNYLEKEIEVNITVSSLANENDTLTEWIYQTPIGQDCTSIYYIYHYNGTGWEDVKETAIMYSKLESENCHITVPLNTNPYQTDQYRIIMDNYILWEIQWTFAMANLSRSQLTPNCLAYASQNNYTYEVPITENTTINYSDSRLYSCHKFFDDLYYIDYYSNLSESPANTVSKLTDYLVEVRWYQRSLTHNLEFADFIMTYYDYLGGDTNITASDIWNYSARAAGIEMPISTYVGGTEYKTNEAAYVSTQFLRAVGDNLIPVNNAVCNVTIYYPNKTIMVANASAPLISGSNGIYTYNFTTPDTEGIYHADFRCDKPIPSASTVYSSGTFHVAPWANFIYSMNSSLYFLMGNVNASLYAYIFQVNNSVYTRIDQINNSITNKIELVETKLDSVNISIYNLILSMNSSITDSINIMNSSITTELYGIRNQLQNVSGDLAQMYLLIGNVNTSLANQLYGIQNNINDLSNLINLTNETVMSKLYKIQDEITSVNDTIKSSNMTIMAKLNAINGDILAVNASLITYLLLLTNASVNISISQQSLFNDMVALWGDSITPKVYTAGLTGFLPSANAQEEGQYVCVDNLTLRKTVNITLDTPDGIRPYSRVIDTQCTYGCKNNTCILPDYTLYIFLFIAVIAMYLIYRHWFSER